MKPIRTMLSVQATPDLSAMRTQSLMNQEHTVIPCIALVEGVLWPANAPGPELALAEEFGRFPQGWNGRPVTYDHPKIEGEPVSASSPDVLQDNAFGQLFNTTLEDGKLKTEIWINEARIAELGEDAQATIQNLKDGTGVAEVSTGLFTMSESIDGVWDGREYGSVWRNIVPDHLAVLPEGIKGACSVEDGCGAPRSNKAAAGAAAEWQPVMRAAQMATDCDCHEEEDEEQSGIFKKLLELGASIFNFKDNSSGISDGDLRTALKSGISATTDDYIYILAVYPNGAGGTVVYESGWDGTLYENSYTVGVDGSITIGSTPIMVRPMTTFVPVQVTANSEIQENAMSKEALVKDLIANEATQYTEDDSEWLSTLEEDTLTKMVPVVAAAKTEVVEEEVIEEEEEAEEVITNAAPVSTDDYVAAAPPEVQVVLNASLKMHRKRKDALVGALVANKRCKFTADDLNAKSVEELENIAALAQDITYEGAATTLTDNSEEQDAGFTPAPSIFAIK